MPSSDRSQIAVVSTIPWDSHLVRSSIWTYPAGAVLGPTIFSIPIEEVFFFIIQTYLTSLLYLLLSRPIVHGAHLVVERSAKDGITNQCAVWRRYHRLGQMALLSMFAVGWAQVYASAGQQYLGLILIWAAPFILLLWTVASQLILSLPIPTVTVAVMLPTMYLWVVDTLAMRRGTWSISSGSKTGIFLWPHLEIEEAIFFLLTNVLVVFGQVAIDMTLAVLDNLQSPGSYQGLPSLTAIFRAIATSIDQYDETRIVGLRDGTHRLKTKSRSFYLASAAFQGALRYDLILLYSFCRAADDLVDEAENNVEGQQWVSKLNTFLDMAYDALVSASELRRWVQANLPPTSQSAFLALPIARLEKVPLVGLVRGFEMDLQFDICQPPGDEKPKHPIGNATWPIAAEQDLELYGSLVAGTVAHLVMNLIFYHLSPNHGVTENAQELLTAASSMGTTLQLVNVVRDVPFDASISRVYLPTSLLKSRFLVPSSVLAAPDSEAIRPVRMQVLQRAFERYEMTKNALDNIPKGARPGMRVAVESYMEIGRTMWEQGCRNDSSNQKGRATVPIGRRLWVAWKNLR